MLAGVSAEDAVNTPATTETVTEYGVATPVSDKTSSRQPQSVSPKDR
jgi:hypothetical protein